MHRRPQDVVQRGGARDLAAEVVEVGRAPGDLAHRLDLGLEPRREVADDDRDHQEEDDGQHVLPARHDEGVVRLGEEEVVDDEAQQARVDRRPQAEADRDQQHRHQKDQRQVGERQEAIRHMGDRDRDHDGQRRPAERAQVGPEAGRARLDQVVRRRLVLGRDDRDLERPAPAQQSPGDALAQPARPAPPTRPAEQDAGDVARPGEGEQLGRDVGFGMQRDGLAAEALGQPQRFRDAVLGLVAQGCRCAACAR